MTRKPKERLKTASVSLRMEPSVKDVAERAARHENRSVSNLIAVLVLNFGKLHGIEPNSQISRSEENETAKIG